MASLWSSMALAKLRLHPVDAICTVDVKWNGQFALEPSGACERRRLHHLTYDGIERVRYAIHANKIDLQDVLLYWQNH